MGGKLDRNIKQEKYEQTKLRELDNKNQKK